MDFSQTLTEFKNHPDASMYRMCYDPNDGTGRSYNFLYAVGMSHAQQIADRLTRVFQLKTVKVYLEKSWNVAEMLAARREKAKDIESELSAPLWNRIRTFAQYFGDLMTDDDRLADTVAEMPDWQVSWVLLAVEFAVNHPEEERTEAFKTWLESLRQSMHNDDEQRRN